MRTLIINLLATALLLFSASSASAWAINMTQQSGPGTATVIAPSDVLVFDIYLDADPGLQFFTVAVLYDDDGILTYNPGAHSGPTYILYTGGKNVTMLIPALDNGQTWVGINQPGKKQVQAASYYEQAFKSAAGSGTGIWVSTLVFHVAGVGDGDTTVSLELLLNGSTIVQANGVDVAPSTVVTGTFNFSTMMVPEPTTALLIGFGIVGLTVAGRRKS